MNLFQKLLKKPNDKYPTTEFRLGKKTIPICAHCGELMPNCRMDVLPYDGKSIKHLSRVFFTTLIKKKKEKNLVVEPCIHTSDMLAQRTLQGDKPVVCASCGVYHQSVLSIKIFDIAVLLCM